MEHFLRTVFLRLLALTFEMPMDRRHEQGCIALVVGPIFAVLSLLASDLVVAAERSPVTGTIVNLSSQTAAVRNLLLCFRCESR